MQQYDPKCNTTSGDTQDEHPIIEILHNVAKLNKTTDEKIKMNAYYILVNATYSSPVAGQLSLEEIMPCPTGLESHLSEGESHPAQDC